MNYLAVVVWFYGATTAAERASYFCSYGLLGTAPSPPIGGAQYLMLMGVG